MLLENLVREDSLTIVARSPAQLGHAIQRFRSLRGMSQAELGNKAAVRQPTISDLESGKGRIKTLTDALAALGLELVVRPKRKATDIDIEELL